MILFFLQNFLSSTTGKIPICLSKNVFFILLELKFSETIFLGFLLKIDLILEFKL